MSKHTPGPWFAASHGRYRVASVTSTTGIYADTPPSAQTAPDARLISAAPDMLDVLLRAKDAIEALDGTSADNEKLVDDYRAVIAKVEGAA